MRLGGGGRNRLVEAPDRERKLYNREKRQNNGGCRKHQRQSSDAVPSRIQPRNRRQQSAEAEQHRTELRSSDGEWKQETGWRRNQNPRRDEEEQCGRCEEKPHTRATCGWRSARERQPGRVWRRRSAGWTADMAAAPSRIKMSDEASTSGDDKPARRANRARRPCSHALCAVASSRASRDSGA